MGRPLHHTAHSRLTGVITIQGQVTQIGTSVTSKGSRDYCLAHILSPGSRGFWSALFWPQINAGGSPWTGGFGTSGS